MIAVLVTAATGPSSDRIGEYRLRVRRVISGYGARPQLPFLRPVRLASSLRPGVYPFCGKGDRSSGP